MKTWLIDNGCSFEFETELKNPKEVALEWLRKTSFPYTEFTWPDIFVFPADLRSEGTAIVEEHQKFWLADLYADLENIDAHLYWKRKREQWTQSLEDIKKILSGSPAQQNEP